MSDKAKKSPVAVKFAITIKGVEQISSKTSSALAIEWTFGKSKGKTKVVQSKGDTATWEEKFNIDVNFTLKERVGVYEEQKITFALKQEGKEKSIGKCNINLVEFMQVSKENRSISLNKQKPPILKIEITNITELAEVTSKKSKKFDRKSLSKPLEGIPLDQNNTVTKTLTKKSKQDIAEISPRKQEKQPSTSKIVNEKLDSEMTPRSLGSKTVRHNEISDDPAKSIKIQELRSKKPNSARRSGVFGRDTTNEELNLDPKQNPSSPRGVPKSAPKEDIDTEGSNSSPFKMSPGRKSRIAPTVISKEDLPLIEGSPRKSPSTPKSARKTGSKAKRNLFDGTDLTMSDPDDVEIKAMMVRFQDSLFPVLGSHSSQEVVDGIKSLFEEQIRKNKIEMVRMRYELENVRSAKESSENIQEQQAESISKLMGIYNMNEQLKRGEVSEASADLRLQEVLNVMKNQLHTRQKEHNAILGAVRERLQRTQESLAEAEKAKVSLRSAYRASEMLQANLQASLTASKARGDQFEEELRESCAKQQQLEAEIEKVREVCDETRTALEQLHLTSKFTLSTLKQREYDLLERDSEIQKMRGEMQEIYNSAKSNQAMQKILEKLARLEKELLETKQSEKRHKDLLASVQLKLDEKNSEICQLKEKLTVKKNDLQMRDRELAQRKKRY